MTYSICIPIYQQKAIDLANELSKQANDLDSILEIIIVDDGSGDKWGQENQAIEKLNKVKFEILENNIGRSAIRNFMAQNASGDFLIFLDGDSIITNKEFLKNYCDFLNPAVLVGGRSYIDQPLPNYELHWKYGRLKESKSAVMRAVNPHSNFHSNNFLIKKDLFQSIGFEEQLSQYGHEDTLFGYRLEENNIKIDHIDNPVIHGTLEGNLDFIRKSELGLQNLLLINNLEPKFKEKSSILKLYLKLNKMGMNPFFKRAYKSQKGNLLNNLNSPAPSLKKFNIYKLLYLFSIS